MLKINRLKKIKSNFPVLVGDKVVEKNTCNLLIDEISKSKAFDDMINRMNEGKVGAVITAGVNPVYSLADSKSFVKSVSYTHLTLPTKRIV